MKTGGLYKFTDCRGTLGQRELGGIARCEVEAELRQLLGEGIVGRQHHFHRVDVHAEKHPGAALIQQLYLLHRIIRMLLILDIALPHTREALSRPLDMKTLLFCLQ